MNQDSVQLIFDNCVKLLRWIADVVGCTYEQVNVITFCFLGPIIFLALLLDWCRLRRKIIRGSNEI